MPSRVPRIFAFNALSAKSTKDISLLASLGLVRQVSLGVERVEAKSGSKLAMLAIKILYLPTIELGQVVELQNVEDALKCAIE